MRLLAAVFETLGIDGRTAYETVPVKVMFACEHLSLVRAGMVCTVSAVEETLVDLLRAL